MPEAQWELTCCEAPIFNERLLCTSGISNGMLGVLSLMTTIYGGDVLMIVVMICLPGVQASSRVVKATFAGYRLVSLTI